jgi:hypothetical protein
MVDPDQLTKQMDKLDCRLDKLDGRHEDLDGRVRRLETTRAVIVALASVFGIGAGIGYVAFQKVNNTVEDATRKSADAQARASAAQEKLQALETLITQKESVLEKNLDELNKRAQLADTTVSLTERRSRQMASGRQAVPAALLKPVSDFESGTPPTPYAWEGYKSDLRSLAKLALNYLELLKRNPSQFTPSNSAAFYDQLQKDADLVILRATQELPTSDTFYDWHTAKAITNFKVLLSQLENEQRQSANSGMSDERIAYYETEFPRWRDGVMGPIG